MLIAIDIGNTTLQIGVFNDRKIVHTWRLATQHDRLPDEYGIFVASLLRYEGIRTAQIDGAIISSVVPALAPVFQEVCRKFLRTEPLLVSSHMRKPVRIGIENAEELGADRIVDAVAACSRYGPPPLIVVDFGTATVFDAINEHGVYIGGAISPGIGISIDALFDRASKLARIDLVASAGPPSAREPRLPCRAASCLATSDWSKASSRASAKSWATPRSSRPAVGRRASLKRRPFWMWLTRT